MTYGPDGSAKPKVTSAAIVLNLCINVVPEFEKVAEQIFTTARAFCTHCFSDELPRHMLRSKINK